MKKIFEQTGTFEAYDAAKTWLKENGYSYGPSCGFEPVAIMKGEYCIAKWRNLTKTERAQSHGTIRGDLRNGPIIVNVNNEPPK